MKFRFLLVVLILFMAQYLFAESNEFYFRFRLENAPEFTKLTNLLSIDKIENGHVYAYANDLQMQYFLELGIFYEELPHPGTLYEAVMSSQKSSDRSWQYYPTYDAFVNQMYMFQTDYPDLCEIHSLGYTVEGREILIAKISDNVSVNEPEPEFLYVSTMHGDETAGYVMMLNLIEYLLQNYGASTRITDLVDNLEIWISPLQNPDGTYYAGNHTLTGARRFNANGVDLNRNFPDAHMGPHPDGNDWQPETIIMMDFAEQKNIVMGANFHGGTEVVNYPWDTWSRLHADDAWYIYTSQIYANSAQANSPGGYMSGYNNGITNGYQWYCVHGSRQDYMNFFQHARETTIEISDVKLLPENQLEDHWNYNREAMLLYLEEALYGIHGFVTDDAGNPLSAKIEISDHDLDNSHVFTDPELGDYHRLLAEGSYDIKFSSYGYLSQVEQDVSVAYASSVQLDITMQQAAQFTVSGFVENGTTGDPIADAQIEILETPLAPEFTNENGFYLFEDVYEGNYQFYISADGYSNLLLDLAVDENNTTHNFQLFTSEIEDFESGDFESFPWFFGGDAAWEIDPVIVFEGNYAAVSGNIGHNQSSSLKIDLEVTAPSEIAFHYKVSSEQNYDFLKFYVNDDLIETWSGSQNWQEFRYPVYEGFHQFEWSYQKDGSISSGSDCGWLDFISFPCTEEMSAFHLPEQKKLLVHGNYPNPFNPSTTISFELKVESPISLEIFNAKGQKINTLIDKKLSSGKHHIIWNGTDFHQKKVSSGIYIFKLVGEDYKYLEKMLLIK